MQKILYKIRFIINIITAAEKKEKPRESIHELIMVYRYPYKHSIFLQTCASEISLFSITLDDKGIESLLI